MRSSLHMMTRACSLAALLGLAGCASAPAPAPVAPPAAAVGADESPADDEATTLARGLDRALAIMTEGYATPAAPYEDAAVQRHVAAVFERVAAAARGAGGAGAALEGVSVEVTDEPAGAAHALPGGRVQVSRGLLAVLGSDAELAFLLGHEVAHLELRHGTRTFLDRMLDLPSDPRLDRDEQQQADARGLALARAAGYTPAGALVALRALSLLLGEVDVAEVNGRLGRLMLLVGPDREGAAGVRPYLDAIEGLAVGPDERAGQVSGQTFRCERDGLAFDLPAGWTATWSGSTLRATGPGEASWQAVAYVRRPALDLGAQVERSLAERPHRATTLGGLPALLSTGAGEREATVRTGGRAWAFAASGQAAVAGLDAALATVRRAPAGQTPAPPRLRLRRAPRAMPLAEALSQLCRPDPSPWQAPLNAGASEGLEAGDIVRCVER